MITLRLRHFGKQIRYLWKTWNYLKSLQPGTMLVPPGHYYSPIPAISELRKREAAIWRQSDSILGLDLNLEEQETFLQIVIDLYPEFPSYSALKQEGLRFYLENRFFPAGDAIFLYAMIRHLRPRHIIEVGSGYSTALMLDVNERFFENNIDITCIEPHPQRLFSLLAPRDNENIQLIQRELQDVELLPFEGLSTGDVLFIDSTHVAKVGSDVDYIFFEILPRLQQGVHIHIHDITFPFEYSQAYVYQGLAWNEAYLLRAFLQYNSAFKIVSFNHFLIKTHYETLASEMPLCLHGGVGIWLRKE
jgi:predicted O-methyltransferase YrrM